MFVGTWIPGRDNFAVSVNLSFFLCRWLLSQFSSVCFPNLRGFHDLDVSFTSSSMDDYAL
jgi:hypothetical protein